MGTFGFRGEALSSLCALSSLSIVTRREEEAVGARLEFDHQGQLKQSIAAARSPGTTVCVKDIFKPLPVRHKVQPASRSTALVVRSCLPSKRLETVQ